MNTLLAVSQLLVSFLFVLIGILALRDWLRERDGSRGWLALAVGSLGLVSLLGRIQAAAALPANEVVTDLNIAIFLLSAYALLRFRGTFIPLRRNTHLAAVAGLAISALIFYVARVGSTPSTSPN